VNVIFFRSEKNVNFLDPKIFLIVEFHHQCGAVLEFIDEPSRETNGLLIWEFLLIL
jgi:hypothetical protein